MKRFGLIVIMIACMTNMAGQTANDIHAIQERITNRDSVLLSVKKSALTDSLRAQIVDYKLLTKALTEKQEEQEKEANKCADENRQLGNDLERYRLLMSSDTLIFNLNISSLGEVPLCLKPHIDLLMDIIEMRQKIEKVEKDIARISEVIKKDLNETIRNNIGNEVDEIYILFEKIKQTGLSSLSEEQKLYFKPGLTERYNQFSKYFE